MLLSTYACSQKNYSVRDKIAVDGDRFTAAPAGQASLGKQRHLAARLGNSTGGKAPYGILSEGGRTTTFWQYITLPRTTIQRSM
jgi:hypothetical protein